MTKRDIVLAIAKQSVSGTHKVKQQQIMWVVQATLDQIRGAVANRQTVELRNFGVFQVVKREARVGRNPKNPGVDVPIPARYTVKFKPGKEMKNDMARLAAGAS